MLAGHSQGAAALSCGCCAGESQGCRSPGGWRRSTRSAGRSRSRTTCPRSACPDAEQPDQGGCVMSWSSFAEPAEPGSWLEIYRLSRRVRRHSRAARARSSASIRYPALPAAARPPRPTWARSKPNAGPERRRAGRRRVPCAVRRARRLLLIGDAPELGVLRAAGQQLPRLRCAAVLGRTCGRTFARRVSAWIR